MKVESHAGSARSTNRRGWLLIALGAYVSVALGWAIASSRRADSQHRLCLDSFTPLIQSVIAFGTRFENDVIAHFARVGLTISVVLVLFAAAGLAIRRARGVKPVLLLLALALAAYAQCLFLQNEVSPGVRFYVAALLLAVAAELLPKRFGSFALEGTAEQPGPGKTIAPFALEIVALAFVTTAALVYRFYALNQLPNEFDGEGAFFMACATSLRGVGLINAGAGDGPWSPFGWLYYVPIYVVTKLFGTHLLSIRFISALTGVVSIPLLWAFLRRLAGPVEALLGSVLLCFALTDMYWSRTDIFPYHAPGLVGIALAWCTYEAITTERLRYFVLAAILMAVSFHQFPSGQTLFLIPLGVVGIRSLLDSPFRKRCWKKALVLLVGAALWFGGQSLNVLFATGHIRGVNPLSLNAGKTLWSLPIESPGLLNRVGPVARTAAQHAANVVRSQFIETVLGGNPHHEGIPTLPWVRPREISAVSAVLLALGFVLLLARPKRLASQLLLVWIFAALLPGLLATSASAHRIGAVFPAFLCVAALAGGDVVRALRTLLGRAGTVVAAVGVVALTAGLGILAARLYLNKASASTPLAVVMSEAIRPYLADGSLAVLDIESGDYLSTELTYLLMDDFNRGSRPPLWRIVRGASWPEIAFRPSPGFGEWYYTETRLRNRRAALLGGPPPKRVVFLVPDTPEQKSHADLLAQLYPRVTPERHVVTESVLRFNFLAFVVDAADLREVTSPLLSEGAGSSLAAGPAGWWEGREARVAKAASARDITVSAGLWVPEQSWSRFRCPGAGEGSRILLDGIRLDEGEARPITRGVHRIDIQLGRSPRLPLFVEQAIETGKFQRFPNENVLGPEVAARPALAPETVLPYPGYDAPVPIASPESSFLAALAVSPSGEIGVLWAYENRWKVALHPAGGQEVAWETPRPEERSELSRIAFAGERIAILNSPHLLLLDRAGRVLLKKDLRPEIGAAYDLGANQAGELFVSATSPPGVFVFSPEGKPITTLLYPDFGPGWTPAKVSVPFRGPLAVLDYSNKVRVFERSSPREWRMERTQPGLYPLDNRLFQVREDGWLFARVWEHPEFLVFDRRLNRRIAEDPTHDLSRFDTGRQLLGFDTIGNLYVYHEDDGKVWKLAKRAP